MFFRSLSTRTRHLDPDILRQRAIKRNEVGVQLLSPSLHRQVFKNVTFPPPPKEHIRISREHLLAHGLDPTKTAALPETSFNLPPLQGNNISEHFHRIGAHAAQPWLALSQRFAAAQLPPKPDDWHIQSGWTKYYYLPDGSSYSEHVPYPIHDGVPESQLDFDVETMPKYHPYAVMACAASPNAWYAWISPWLLGETDDPAQLIPLGAGSKTPQIIVGHNVSYDRIRILDEYDARGTATRFVDTMSLHIAVHGISAHQRPAWMKYRKARDEEEERHAESVQAVVGLIAEVRERETLEQDPDKQADLRRLIADMEESLVQLRQKSSSPPLPNNDTPSDDVPDAEEDESSQAKKWEDITSANSLADVAKLHCGIVLDKAARNDLMELEPSQIRENITDYLDYCASDVAVTHAVFAVTLPAFLRACPHPVSFAGILTMGSSFLPVDENWETYLKNAEGICKDMEDKVQNKLKALAEEAKSLMDRGEEETWKNDPWLSQLDWTPKVAGKSRGIYPPEDFKEYPDEPDPALYNRDAHAPKWYLRLLADPLAALKTDPTTLPMLLKLSFTGHPVRFSEDEGWHYLLDDDEIKPILLRATQKSKTKSILVKAAAKLFDSGQLTSTDADLAKALCEAIDDEDDIHHRITSLANSLVSTPPETRETDPWLSQLDWTILPKQYTNDGTLIAPSKRSKLPKPKPLKPPPVIWPKWYWEAKKPRKDMAPGTLEVTVRNRIAPILLRLSWSGYPLFHSREHGWTFRVPGADGFKTRYAPMSFYAPEDEALQQAALTKGYLFYKLPHKDGDAANVANPLGKTFLKYAVNGTLRSPGDEAKEALDLNAMCSYWISARDRVMNQLVIWQQPQQCTLGLPQPSEPGGKYGIILPQMTTMGTVTRRAIEKTWLTASNAKKTRVGSELKAMVRAPRGYAIVGADVDSEELWIASCMGDAQFGFHGASAIGWMTLEGTKAAGTDLHSKTASILGISRDQAKVFNYSRIYGAGMRHAMLLLLQSNASMLPEEAQKLADNLYASTKGKNTHRTDIFDRKFWFGGTESYLFNKLEEIATSDKPQTPALGCGVTYALSKEYLPEGFGTDYMPSRINWAVQSSGVDYLHLLIVSMDHLIAKYGINARYMLSVHDELRYLVAEEDRYRAALAMQIANLWTRALFAYKLGMDDLPQGVAFFSAVDVDHVLRKEVDMPCVTPSQPVPIPPGESLDIVKVLEKTNGGSLMKDGAPMPDERGKPFEGTLEGYQETNCLRHRASSPAFLKAQATKDFGEVKGLAQQATGKRFEGGNQRAFKQRPKTPRRKPRPIGNGEGFDWSEEVERVLAS
ncbi:DNA polymerase gamma, mitochondrial [Psilocybe cubensis]|uniref:DNA polymerase gamma, mitochondrial n=2 Tax=Psilocybe cubensis TaxID=181762 RepID=A0ACB8HGY9_PSICU|nr:DNA polymerase gamma, mitochondrial [Psilocybe cubensis]KAH9487178.1 DNA polymerase gamma, mitochondrial [Psilocybe cubensis]